MTDTARGRNIAIGAWVLLTLMLLSCAGLGETGGSGTLPSARASASPPVTPLVTAAPSTEPHASVTPSATVGLTGVPLCENVPYISAPADWYRESPIYVGNEMPTDQVRSWALRQPGFVDIWIDRNHNGWVTVAFTEGAAERQVELEEQFPGVGVVAAELPWTQAFLQDLQRRVASAFAGNGLAGSGIYPNKGVVSIDFAVRTPELVAQANAQFGSDPVCISGLDPADVPAEGPQRVAGDGWRLLADEDEAGEIYRTAIAYDANSYAQLWDAAGLGGKPAQIDFESEVAIWFGIVHGSSCPRTRLDDVIADLDRSLVYSEVTYLDELGACTADAIPHAYVVAFERARLPRGPFAIQLASEDPSSGVIDSRTMVEVDLSPPGAVAGPGEVHRDNSDPAPYFVTPGGIVETGYQTLYRQPTECGLEWLGPLNGVSWRTDEASGSKWLPEAWAGAVRPDGLIELEVLITTDPASLQASANGASIPYTPTTGAIPSC